MGRDMHVIGTGDGTWVKGLSEAHGGAGEVHGTAREAWGEAGIGRGRRGAERAWMAQRQRCCKAERCVGGMPAAVPFGRMGDGVREDAGRRSWGREGMGR